MNGSIPCLFTSVFLLRNDELPENSGTSRNRLYKINQHHKNQHKFKSQSTLRDGTKELKNTVPKLLNAGPFDISRAS